MTNYPSGVSNRDFYERSEYEEYLLECLADGTIPCSEWQFDQWRDDEEVESEEDE